MHTHKHLSLPIRESECSNLQKVLTQYGSDLVHICCQTKSSKLKLSISETGMNVAHLLNVAMSGRFSVSTLCSYCPHCGLALTKAGGYRSAKNSPQREAPAEDNNQSGGFLVCWIVSWFNLLKPIWLHILNSISTMLPFYAQVRMSASLEGPEINTPVCTCGWLMWKLISESCFLRTDKWLIVAICYIEQAWGSLTLRILTGVCFNYGSMSG